MKILTPLSDEDIYPYTQSNNVAVRIYKNGKWFLGLKKNLTSLPDCRLHLEPMIRFIPKSDIDDWEGRSLTMKSDEITTLEHMPDTQPFLPFENPLKITDNSHVEDVLRIQFEDGHAILSCLATDYEDVTDLLDNCK